MFNPICSFLPTHFISFHSNTEQTGMAVSIIHSWSFQKSVSTSGNQVLTDCYWCGQGVSLCVASGQNDKSKVLKMAHGECWQLTTELLPPKWIDLLDLVGPPLKKPLNDVKAKIIWQVLSRSSAEWIWFEEFPWKAQLCWWTLVIIQVIFNER